MVLPPQLQRGQSFIELVGAKTLPSGAQRGALLRMSDLGRLALIGAKAGHDMFVPVVDFH